jgi:excinuclease ABC subunit A
MIQITGARTHNLQNLQIEIPVGKLTVITGVSGSGKSSLVFDTIFAEGRRRYLSSVSVRSRELLQKADRPDIDLIEGLPPVLMVSQGGMASRAEATVATISEINEYLRLLYTRVGQNCQRWLCAGAGGWRARGCGKPPSALEISNA